MLSTDIRIGIRLRSPRHRLKHYFTDFPGTLNSYLTQPDCRVPSLDQSGGFIVVENSCAPDHHLSRRSRAAMLIGVRLKESDVPGGVWAAHQI
jgi:hypothetical protein